MTRAPRSLRRATVAAAYALLTALSPASAVSAQAPATVPVPRPIPAAVTPPQGYQTAASRGWRTAEGSPGATYWLQQTAYDIDARLDPETGLLEGTERITYVNRAPVSLQTVWLHLHQNFHKPEAPRSRPAELTDGITLNRVRIGDEEVDEESPAEGPGYRVEGTLMQLRPGAPLDQGDELHLEIDWVFNVPESGMGGRMGHSDREVYLLAYWFPKMAVLDDLRVWDAQPFLGNAEFYDDFADYTVSLTVPAGWTVMATGELQNPEEVYSAYTLDQLSAAATADTLVTIAGVPEREAGVVTTEGEDGLLTYEFVAERVRDFVWTTSNVQRWDATSALVADRSPYELGPVMAPAEESEADGDDEEDEETAEVEPEPDPDGDVDNDRVLIHSFWREDRAPLWADEWLYAKQSIEFHSEYTGYPYPWPHMTSVEGADIIGGGMEYPMMTLMGSYEGRGTEALYNVTAHELGHMWIPMIVGTNEKRYAWMDEGSTDFLENESRMENWPGVDHRRVEAQEYLGIAGTADEQAMMRHADYYEPGPGYSIAAYRKPATMLVALRQVVGTEVFEEAYRTFISEWAFKHPTPWDLFRTFERFAERDLDWFWTAFYYETWTLDHAVGDVRRRGTGGPTVVTIEDRGQASFPASVRIRTSGGETLERQVPVEHWLAGNTSYDIEVPASAGAVTRVEIDPTGYAPDVDRSNNLWPRG